MLILLYVTKMKHVVAWAFYFSQCQLVVEMDKRKRTPKDTLTDLLLEFIEAAVHEFL